VADVSFILDALKKSENDRQRQIGPALFQVRVAPPRSRFPAWAIAVGALLLLNLAVVAWIVLRSQPSSAAPAAQTAQQALPQPSPAASGAAVAPPVPRPEPSRADMRPVVPPEPLVESEPLIKPESARLAGLNPDDYAPAREPAPHESEPTVIRGTASGLPTYEQAKADAGGSIPELRLDMHVYAAKPSDRFVFINMRKLKEGEALPEGVRVERITHDGAELSWRGSRFTIDRN